jgi:hypothetical protein
MLLLLLLLLLLLVLTMLVMAMMVVTRAEGLAKALERGRQVRAA